MCYAALMLRKIACFSPVWGLIKSRLLCEEHGRSYNTYKGTSTVPYLQAAANHAIDRIITTSTHANDLDAGIAPCTEKQTALDVSALTALEPSVTSAHFTSTSSKRLNDA